MFNIIVTNIAQILLSKLPLFYCGAEPVIMHTLTGGFTNGYSLIGSDPNTNSITNNIAEL